MIWTDGVFFGVPDDVYHNIPRFSSSGVKDLQVSELDFWVKSWMNPENDKPKDEDPRDSMFKLKGRAYHCRVLEGAEEFKARYAYSLDPDAFANRDILVTSKDITRELKRLGLKGFSSYDKTELIGLLLANEPETAVWDYMVEVHARRCGDRTIIPHQWQRDIEFGVAMIEKHPVLQHAFKGGFPEVTCLWTKTVEDDDGSGRIYTVPMKCKFDRLKPGAIVDYKTFSNPLRKKLPQAIISAMGAQRNHIQVAVYHDASDNIVTLLNENKAAFWDEGEKKLCPIEVSRNPEIAELATGRARSFVFVYQQTGAAPVAIGRILPRSSNMVDIGKLEFETAAVKFAKCLAAFGSEPWVSVHEIEEFEDEQFPAWMAH